MPNGGERNYIRLCAAIDGFRVRYGVWPTHVVVEQPYVDEIRDRILMPGEFDRLNRDVKIVAGDARFRAVGEHGTVYDYEADGFTGEQLDVPTFYALNLELRPDPGG